MAAVVTVRLITNPSTDTEFQRRAEQMMRIAHSPSELEQLLRPRYQRVHVVPGVTDIFERWYVYREGHWVQSEEH